MAQDLRVFVIDDDPLVVATLGQLLRANGFPVEGFTSAGEFLERPVHDGLACLLLDLRLRDQSGLDVQDDLHRRGFSLPIVFLSGKADVPSTARAMREGALDFLVNPSTSQSSSARWHARERRRLPSSRKSARNETPPNVSLA